MKVYNKKNYIETHLGIVHSFKDTVQACASHQV